MSTEALPTGTTLTTPPTPVPEVTGAHYVRLMRQAVLHPDDPFHQEAVEQLDRLRRPWRSMNSTDLRSVLEGIHDELFVLLHQLDPRAC